MLKTLIRIAAAAFWDQRSQTPAGGNHEAYPFKPFNHRTVNFIQHDRSGCAGFH